MATIIDATVVASAYDTGGNGGRKLVKLSNNWIVASANMKNNGTYPDSGQIAFYVDKRDGQGFKPYGSTTNNYNDHYAIASYGMNVYLLTIPRGYPSDTAIRAKTIPISTDWDGVTQTTISNGVTLANSLGTSGYKPGPGCSIIVNDEGTEIHVAFPSKITNYTNSANIFYVKGIINADGSVTWGTVEQVTKNNNQNGQGIQNPSITLVNNVPVILAETWSIYFNSTGTGASNGYYGLIAIKRSNELVSYPTYFNINWTYRNLTSGTSHAQYSPSVIFVPSSINGLTNGRIWATWHGKDSTDAYNNHIRVSYSDDGGVTWSAMETLTSGTQNTGFPSITANYLNEIFIVFQQTPNAYYGIRQLKFSNSVWSNTSIITSENVNDKRYPSTLYDINTKFTSPLFIYQNIETSKVGFYGTWTITTISVAPGDIGEKTNSSLLSYAITTDGAMSTITEKVNGVVVSTKTATSGEPLITGLTQAQWDAIKYGKYADVTGGKNTLTIEMGTEKWTYTFDKRLATDADILSAVKAVQDSQNVYLPAIKQKLADKVEGNAANNFEEIIDNIQLGKKFASGTVISSSVTKGFDVFGGTNGSATNVYVDIDLSTLGFKPSVIVIKATDNTVSRYLTTWMDPPHYYNSTYNSTITCTYSLNDDGYRIPYVNGVMSFPVAEIVTSYTWQAYE